MYDQNGRKRVVQKTQPAMGPFAIFVTVFIVILFIAASFCAGYYVGANFKVDLKKGSIEKQKSNKIDDSLVTDYKVTDPKVASLIDNLAKSTDSDCWSLEDFVNDRKITAAEISNTRAWTIAEMNNYHTSGFSEIKEKDAIKEVRKYLGQDYQFVPAQVKMELNPCLIYKYDSKLKAFLKVDESEECRTHICQAYSTVYKIVKATDINGNLDVTIKVLFAGKDSDVYYSDYNRTNAVGRGDTGAAFLIKGADYKFKFKLVENNYVFVSSEPVK